VLKGVHLTLLVGPVLPVPAPKAVVDALQSVTVTTAAGAASGFQLTFAVSSHSPLQTLLVLAGGRIPWMRVLLVVTINGQPQVLSDGLVTNQEVSASNDPGASTLTVTGKDLTTAMDQIEMSGLPFPAMPAEARIALIIAKYAMFGMIPLVIPAFFSDLPLPIDRIPTQQGTDLQYVNQLAKEVGYVFYVDPGPAPGTNTAYWGPEIKVGVPQAALNIGMDAHSNCESLSFKFSNEGAVQPVVYIQEPLTKTSIPIPIPDVSLLNPPLGAIPPIPKAIEFLNDTAKLSPMLAISKGLAKAASSSDVVTANGSLDILRYGRLLKARSLVGVRGAGVAFDGLYYVKSVTTTLKAGELKQSFVLTRNGLVSTVPVVPI
jgi:hypothetical protein